MIYILFSVCCNVIVSVLLKLARRYSIDIFQAITWNYSMALFLTWVFYKPHIINIQIQQLPTVTYITLAILFPALFLVIGWAIKSAGIIRTAIAQRLSLFIAFIAAFLLFNAQPTPLEITGLIIGIAAIICVIPWQKIDPANRRSPYSWLYLLIVFTGFGVIDVLLKQVATFTAIPFTTSLFIIFGLAFTLSQLVLLYTIIAKKIKFTIRHIFFGWILGIANFGNTLFYLMAPNALSTNPSTVFLIINIGVITLGAVVGLVIFKERLNTLNKIGILLAIVAIIVTAYSQMH